MRSLLLAALLVMKIAWRTGPLAVILTGGEVVSTVLRFIQPLIVGLIITSLVDRSLHGVVLGTGLLVISLGLGGALEAVAVGYRVKLIEDVGYAFDIEVMRALAEIREIDRLEEPRLATAVSKVRDRADAMGYCFNGLASVIIQAAAPITSIVVAFVVDPRLVLLTLAGIPTIFVTRRLTRLQDEADDVAQPHSAQAAAWAELIREGNAAAERKLFRLWEWHGRSTLDALMHREAALRSPLKFDSIATLVADVLFLVCAGLVLLWVLAAGGAGIAAGTAASALLVSLDLKGTLGALRLALSNLGPSLRAAVSLREVQRTAGEALRGASAQTLSAEPRVDLRDVTYHYPGSDTPALKAVSLHIDSGEVVAIVGVNGAGKSTLVEILLRIRRATGEKVELPGIGWQSMVAQNFARFDMTVGENVTLSDWSEGEQENIRQALLTSGAPTPWRDAPVMQIGVAWGGIEPSDGQWQALAAGRCFYRTDARLVVLDEPTAALDPEAQESVTTRYMTMARDIASRGGIAVLITHRMSMPRHADKIVVLDDGRVVEYGTHQELLELNGRYADAYRAQTAGFLERAK